MFTCPLTKIKSRKIGYDKTDHLYRLYSNRSGDRDRTMAARKLAEERFILSRTVEGVDQFYTTLLQKKGIR